MVCEEVAEVLSDRCRIVASESGCAILTDCYYPSADRVYAYVNKLGEGYRVSDGGDAARVVFLHGQSDAVLSSALSEAAKRYDLDAVKGTLVAVADRDWLEAAVLAVANGAAMAAYRAISSASASRDDILLDAIVEAVSRVVPRDAIRRNHRQVGASGKEWPIDLAITAPSRPILINGIKPHPASISSSYTAFSDIAEVADARRWAVYQDLLAPDDLSLLSRVAEIMPVSSLERGARELGLGS